MDNFGKNSFFIFEIDQKAFRKMKNLIFFSWEVGLLVAPLGSKMTKWSFADLTEQKDVNKKINSRG